MSVETEDEMFMMFDEWKGGDGHDDGNWLLRLLGLIIPASILELITGILLSIGVVVGCQNSLPDQPEWLDVGVRFYNGANEYLYTVEVYGPNQQVEVPLDATLAVFEFASRVQNGTRTAFKWSINLNSGDGFDYELAHGEASESATEPVTRDVIVRDAAGNPTYEVLHVRLDVEFVVEGPYHNEVPWTGSASWTLVPEVPPEVKQGGQASLSTPR